MKLNILKLTLLFLVCLVLAFLNLMFAGSEKIQPDYFHPAHFVFWQIRLPKMTSAILAGSALSVSGLILQVLFRNPLAGPYVLGISSGASFMVALTLMGASALGWQLQSVLGSSSIVLSAIMGGLTVTLLISGLAVKVKNNTILLLMGLMLGQIIGAAQGFLEYFSTNDSLKRFVVWSLGSVRNVTNSDLLLFFPSTLGALLICLFLSKSLQLLTLGDYYAENLGLKVKHHRLLWICLSSVLTGITTAFCGPIAFVGISVPVASRLLFKTSSQLFHLISCCLLGAGILLLSDLMCFMPHQHLPLNLVTTLIGCPLVVYLMFKQKAW